MSLDALLVLAMELSRLKLAPRLEERMLVWRVVELVVLDSDGLCLRHSLRLRDLLSRLIHPWLASADLRELVILLGRSVVLLTDEVRWMRGGIAPRYLGFAALYIKENIRNALGYIYNTSDFKGNLNSGYDSVPSFLSCLKV